MSLRTPVTLVQDEIDFLPVLEIYRRRQPQRVLELGTYVGGTLYHWLQNAPPGAVVVSVDLYEDADNSELYPGWCPPGVGYEIIRGDTRDPKVVAAAAELGPYDWIFIDAGHHDDEVRADWENYRPLVSPDGIVAFHDIAHLPALAHRIQVYKLWAEIRERRPTLEFATPGASGIGLVLPGTR